MAQAYIFLKVTVAKSGSMSLKYSHDANQTSIQSSNGAFSDELPEGLLHDKVFPFFFLFLTHTQTWTCTPYAHTH